MKNKKQKLRKKELQQMVVTLKKENTNLRYQNKILNKQVKTLTAQLKCEGYLCDIGNRLNEVKEKLSCITVDTCSNIANSIFGSMEDMLAFKIAYDNYLICTEHPLDITQFVADGTLVRNQLFGCFGDFISNLSESFCERLVKCINMHGERAVLIFFENMENYMNDELLPMMESLDDHVYYTDTDAPFEYNIVGRDSRDTDHITAEMQYDENQEELASMLIAEENICGNYNCGKAPLDANTLDIEREEKANFWETIGDRPRFAIDLQETKKGDHIDLQSSRSNYIAAISLLKVPYAFDTARDEYIFDHYDPIESIRKYSNAYYAWIECALDICHDISKEDMNIEYLTNEISEQYSHKYKNDITLPKVNEYEIKSFALAWLASLEYYLEDGEYYYDRTKDKCDPIYLLIEMVMNNLSDENKRDCFYGDILDIGRFSFKTILNNFITALNPLPFHTYRELNSDVINGHYDKSLGTDILFQVLYNRQYTELLDAIYNFEIGITNTDESKCVCGFHNLKMIVCFVLRYDKRPLCFASTENILKTVQENFDDFVNSKSIGYNPSNSVKYLLYNATLFIDKLLYIYIIKNEDQKAIIWERIRKYPDYHLKNLVKMYIEGDPNTTYIYNELETIFGEYDLDIVCDMIISILCDRYDGSYSIELDLTAVITKLAKDLNICTNIVTDAINCICENNSSGIVSEGVFNICGDTLTIMASEGYEFKYISLKTHIKEFVNNNYKRSKMTNKNKSPYYISDKFAKKVDAWGEEKQLQFLEDCKSGMYSNSELLEKYNISNSKGNKSKVIYYLCIDVFNGSFDPKDYLNRKNKKPQVEEIKEKDKVSDDNSTKDKDKLSFRKQVLAWGREKQLRFLEDCKNPDNTVRDIVEKYGLRNHRDRYVVVHIICGEALKDENLNARDYLKRKRTGSKK